MKTLTKRIYLIGLTVLLSFCCLFLGVLNVKKTEVKADATTLETEFTNDGQFTVSKYNGAVPFEYIDGATEGLPTGYTGSVLKLTTTSNLAYVSLDFSTAKIKASSVDSIVVRIYSPGYTSADEFRTNVAADGSQQVQYGTGAYDMSSWCDITLNATSFAHMTDANGYLAFISVGARVKGGAEVYYIDSVTVNMKETKAVEFTGVHSFWNNYVHANLACSILEFSGGIGVGNLDGDYSDVYAKATLNGKPVDSSNLDFVCRNWVDGQGDSIVMRWKTLPAAGSVLHIPAGASFKNGGEDTNLYSISKDIYLEFNGTTWAICEAPVVVETVPVTFNTIHSTWNNYSHPQDGAPCTFLEFDGGITGNGNLDANFGDLLTSMTMNGAAVDTTNISFYCPNWIGAEGGIVMRLETNPAAGAILHIPAGTTFNIGGTDTNVYEITEDIDLEFDGAKWSVMEKPAEDLPKATFVGPWGTQGDFNGAATLLLQYNVEAAWDHTDKGNLASKVTYKNSQTSGTRAVTNDDISGWPDQKWIVFQNLTGYNVIEILEGATFGGVSIPAGEFKFDTTLNMWLLNEELEYGTPNLPAVTADMVGPWTWNHNTENTAVIKDNNYGYTVIGSWSMAENATNLAATDSLTSRSITLNGKSFYELYQEDDGYRLDSIILYVGFSVPTSALVASNGYEYPTLEIKEGTPFYDGNYLPKTTLIYKDGAWQLKVDEPTDTPTDEPTEVDYTPDFVSIGDINHLNNDALGAYGLSLKYYTLGFTTPSNQVMAVTNSGFSLNGEAINVALWGDNQLLFWLKKTECEPGYNGYSHATLAIEEGAKITNEAGDEYTFSATTLYLVNGEWTTEEPADYEIVLPDPLPYMGMANIWNNLVTNGLSQSILEFGTHGVDFLGDAADPTNYAKLKYGAPISTALTINGKTIGELYEMDNNVQVSYAHGNNYLYIAVPEYLLASNGNGCTTLHLADRTTFLNALLPEVTLYLYKGQWTTEKPEMVETEDTEYTTVTDMFGAAEKIVKAGETAESAITANGSVVYNFLMQNDCADNKAIFSTHYTTTANDGIQVVFTGDKATASERVTVIVNGQEMASETYLWTANEWFSVRVAVTVGDTVSVSVAIDGIYVTKAEGITATLGEKVAFASETGVNTLGDYKTGDLKKPILYWEGKEVYYFNANEVVPSDETFLRAVSAMDAKDGVIASENISVLWQDGAVVDGKLQEGTWTVVISASDTSGNKANYAIIVVVEDENKVVVTFDGVASETIYHIGDLLVEPETPVKENSQFIGWYVGDVKWDFVNDVVTGDIALTAKFVETNATYTIVITSEGLASNYTYTFELAYGATVENALFAREGFTYKVFAGEVEVETITVEGAANYTVVYTEIVETPEDPGTSETPEEPEEPGTSEEPEDPITSEEPEEPTTSEVPEEPATSEKDSQADSSSSSSGCGSVVAMSAVGMLTMAGAAVLMNKKKED